MAKKVRETYGMNNHVHFPNENLLVGRLVECTSLQNCKTHSTHLTKFFMARPVEPVPNQGIYVPWPKQGLAKPVE